jgi:predicted aspartyl protease
MGLTYVEGVLTGPTGKTANLRFLVDSGATYSLVPNDVWQHLDLSPKRVVTFTLADGTQISRSVSECHLSLPKATGIPR